MGRTLSAELASLIASGDCREYFTLDVELQDGTELHLATAPLEVGDTVYQALLSESGVMRLSLFGDDDNHPLKVSNVDPSFGQTLTGQVNMLDGARATSGVAFEDKQTLALYWDERLPGMLLSGDVTEKDVSFDLVDELFAIMVEGDRCEDVFPFVQPPEASVQPDPDDTNPAPLLPSPRRPEPGDLPPFNRYGRLIES